MTTTQVVQSLLAELSKLAKTSRDEAQEAANKTRALNNPNIAPAEYFDGQYDAYNRMGCAIERGLLHLQKNLK